MSTCPPSFSSPLLRGLPLVLLLSAGPAWGQISAVAVDPSSPCSGTSATVKVEGDGACNGTLAFGDGTPAAPFSALPFTTTHTWTSNGSYTLSATSATCGNASLQVDVRQCRVAGRAPERRIRPQRKAAAVPQIEAVITFGIEPGAAVLVAGKLFGDSPGRVILVGINGTSDLQVENWGPTGITGTVPQDADAACLTGSVRVQASTGVSSEPFQARVNHATKLLPMEDVTVVSCGNEGNQNNCNGHGDEGDLCVDFLFPPWYQGLDREGRLLGEPGPAVAGYHSNCWGAVGDDSGTDTYRIGLKNGWVLDSAQFLSKVPEDEGHTIPRSGSLPAGFVGGATSWEPSIQWSVTPNDAVIYNLYVTIRGPACVSHK